MIVLMVRRRIRIITKREKLHLSNWKVPGPRAPRVGGPGGCRPHRRAGEAAHAELSLPKPRGAFGGRGRRVVLRFGTERRPFSSFFFLFGWGLGGWVGGTFLIIMFLSVLFWYWGGPFLFFVPFRFFDGGGIPKGAMGEKVPLGFTK